MPSNFPTRAPVGLIAGVFLGVVSLVPILAGWRLSQLPVQKFYLGQYVASYLSQTPIGTVAAFLKHSQRHDYYVLMQNGHPLSGAGPETGSAISVQVLHTNSPGDFHTWMRARIYDGREVPQLVQTPLATWGISATFLFLLGAMVDFFRRKRAREGVKLRGGDLMTAAEFNRATKGDGFGLYVRK